MDLRDVSSTRVLWCLFFVRLEVWKLNEEKKIVEKAIEELQNKLETTDCTEKLKFTPKDILLKRDIDFINKVKLDKEYQARTKTWKDYTRQEQAELIMRYVDDIELALVGKEVGEIIMRLRQYYDVYYTESTYYVQDQVFYFNFVEDNSAIVRVFPLEDYYQIDPDNKMKTYRFGILYINEEDKFQMQEIDSSFEYIPDETNDSVIYMKEPIPISVSVKPVKFCEDNTK